MEKRTTKIIQKTHTEQYLLLETKKSRILRKGKPSTLRAATRQLKAAHHRLTVKAAKPNMYPKIQNGLDEKRNKRSYMVLYVMQKVSH
jgi:hypothetical protein